MIILTKEKERILKHIISLPKNAHNTLSIGNKMTTYPENIDDKKLIQILTYLEQVNFIKIKWISVHHDNLNCAIDITLLPDGSNYFNNKKEISKSNRREWIKTYIPIIISLIALVKSFETEIISIMKLVMQLLKK